MSSILSSNQPLEDILAASRKKALDKMTAIYDTLKRNLDIVESQRAKIAAIAVRVDNYCVSQHNNGDFNVVQINVGGKQVIMKWSALLLDQNRNLLWVRWPNAMFKRT